jgi:hypothetical protein
VAASPQEAFPAGALAWVRWDPTSEKRGRVVRWTKTGNPVVTIEKVDGKGRPTGAYGSERTFRPDDLLRPATEGEAAQAPPPKMAPKRTRAAGVREELAAELDASAELAGRAVATGARVGAAAAVADATLLRAALERLVAAADDFASSDPEMPSHRSTEEEHERAVAEAKAALAGRAPARAPLARSFLRDDLRHVVLVPGAEDGPILELRRDEDGGLWRVAAAWSTARAYQDATGLLSGVTHVGAMTGLTLAGVVDRSVIAHVGVQVESFPLSVPDAPDAPDLGSVEDLSRIVLGVLGALPKGCRLLEQELALKLEKLGRPVTGYQLESVLKLLSQGGLAKKNVRGRWSLAGRRS